MTTAGRQWVSLEVENEDNEGELSPIYDFNTRKDHWMEWREFSGMRSRKNVIQLVVWVVLVVLLLTFFFLYLSERSNASSNATTPSAPASFKIPEAVEEGSLFYSESGYRPFEDFKLDVDYRGVSRVQTSKKGMVVSDHGDCSDMGGEILNKGGNAMDAAVTTALCIGVRNAFASGTGGGAFILVHAANGTTSFIDAREVAPKSSTKNMFKDQGHIASQMGGKAIAVPLELKGLEMLSKSYGRLAWKDLVIPVIPLARHGFPASPLLLTRYNFRTVFDELKEVFFILDNGTWRMPNLGEICCKRPTLADTLELVAEKGVEAVYRSKWGDDLVEDIRTFVYPGFIEKEDLVTTKPVVKEPIQATVYGMDVFAAPPPSSGATLIMALKLMESYDDHSNTTLNAHRLIEAMKHMFAVRSHFGDPGVHHQFGNMDQILQDIFEDSFIDSLRNSTSDEGTLASTEYGGKYKMDAEAALDAGTSHICIADADGNAVSITESINGLFGSHVISKKTGLLLNNHMDDFSKPGMMNVAWNIPASNNFIHPGRKPLSSMSPTMFFRDGRLHLIIGGSGGPAILTGLLQVLYYHFQHGENVTEAQEEPRLNDFLVNRTFYEDAERGDSSFKVNADLVKRLEHLGQHMRVGMSASIVNVLEVLEDNKAFRGFPDSRKDGAAASNL